MATLDPYFGKHAGQLQIYVSKFPIGNGSFGAFANFQATFTGSYTLFFQQHQLQLAIALTDKDVKAVNGPCELTMNGQVDKKETYQTNNGKMTIRTALAQTPIVVYQSQAGTQLDGLDGHNAWIG